MEWILLHRGDLLVIAILAAVTVTILTNLLKKRNNPCGSCSGCCHSCSKKETC